MCITPFGFPVEPEVELDLDLERFHIMTPATRIVAMTDAGEIDVPLPDITLLRGHVVGDPESPAAKVIEQIARTLGERKEAETPSGIVGRKLPLSVG